MATTNETNERDFTLRHLLTWCETMERTLDDAERLASPQAIQKIRDTLVRNP